MWLARPQSDANPRYEYPPQFVDYFQLRLGVRKIFDKKVDAFSGDPVKEVSDWHPAARDSWERAMTEIEKISGMKPDARDADGRPVSWLGRNINEGVAS